MPRGGFAGARPLVRDYGAYAIACLSTPRCDALKSLLNWGNPCVSYSAPSHGHSGPAPRNGVLPWQQNRSGSKREIAARACRSEEHTSELQSLMRISYAVFCLKKKKAENE